MAFQLGDKGRLEFERQQIGIGKVAVVMRLFFRTHRARLPFRRIEQPRFLVDFAAILDNLDLTARLYVDRLTNEPDRVDVLYFAAGSELGTRLAYGNIYVCTEIALLHVAITGAEIAQNGAQFGDKGLRLLC